MLRRTVRRHAGLPLHKTGCRHHVHHAAPRALLEEGQTGLGHGHHGEEVDLKGGAEVWMYVCLVGFI
jgi:hypothetical protein